MTINLVSVVSQFLTPQLVGRLAGSIGVNEAVAQKVVAAAIPAILAALGTAAAAPGGAKKVSEAIASSDKDIFAKIAQAASGGDRRPLDEGANLLSGLLGGGALPSLTSVLSQYSGAPRPATQTLLGAVAQTTVGAIGQQDPSNWSGPSAIVSLFRGQESAISAALPAEISKALSGSGLLAGLTAAAGAAQAATARVSSGATVAAGSAPVSAQAAPRPRGFPMWALLTIVFFVLLAIFYVLTDPETVMKWAKR